MLAKRLRAAVSDALKAVVEQQAYRRYEADYTERLTEAMCKLVGRRYCQLFSSGTTALEIALRSAGIGAGDEVILSAYDYPGNFWAIEQTGAQPVVIDTDGAGWGMSLEQLRSAAASTSSSRCKAVIVSHLHGHLQDSRSIRDICEQQGLLFVEDCCQATGGANGGATEWLAGDVAIASFGGGKVLSAGRGGCLLTSDSSLAQRARRLAGVGRGPYGLSEVQAAIVLAQLPLLGEMCELSCQFFSRLAAMLRARESNCGPVRIDMPGARHVGQSTYYQTGWLIRSATQGSETSTESRDKILTSLQDAGVPAGVGFKGFHRRSSRRCRRPYALTQVVDVVASTLVIHHDAAIDPWGQPDEVAYLFNACVDRTDSAG